MLHLGCLLGIPPRTRGGHGKMPYSQYFRLCGPVPVTATPENNQRQHVSEWTWPCSSYTPMWTPTSEFRIFLTCHKTLSFDFFFFSHLGNVKSILRWIWQAGFGPRVVVCWPPDLSCERYDVWGQSSGDSLGWRYKLGGVIAYGWMRSPRECEERNIPNN